MDISNGLNVCIWMLLPICVLALSSSESWIKNCQQYHESSEFCADLLKMTSKMIDKRLLKNSAFDQATIKQTVETVLPRKSKSNHLSKSIEKSIDDSIKTDESNGKNSLGRSSREESTDDVSSDEYEYFEKNLTEPRGLDSDYIPSESEENYVKELQARGKSSNTEEKNGKDPLVKKTFGYKVTLYKNPDSKEPPVVTEEFFGDGDKKLIKILGSPKSSTEKNNEYESQSSSASRLFIPELLDSDEEKVLSSPRDWSLAGTLRGHYKHAKDKGLDDVSSMKNAGDEKQRDKKGAKEKALREKTQIEFFEREKIFHDDKKGRQAKHRYIDSFAEKSAPDDSNGMNFKNLHDLLLKRLKGWREKGYKITTELEIVHRGASHDKSREVKQRGANKKALHQHLKEAIDAKKEGFMEGSKNPENSGRETLPMLDYPDVISFDPGTDHSGGERFFIRTTLAPHKLRTTKVVHYITVAKNPTLSSGQNKKLATLSYLLGNQKQPPSIDISSILRNNFIGQKDQPNSNFQNAVSIPILASLDGTSNSNSNNDNDSARKKIIITRPINNHKLLDQSNGKIFTIGQPVIYQNPSMSTSNEGPKTNLLSNVIGQPITLLQNPPTIRIAGINNGNVNSQSLYGQTFRGSPTVITLEPPSGSKPSLTDQLENLKTGFVPQVVTSPNKSKKQQNVASSNPSSRPTQQPDKMKLSPVAFEEPPNKVRLPPQQQKPPNERPPYFSMSDPSSDRPGMSFQGFNQANFPPPPPPGHEMADDHFFNDFDVDLGQPPSIPNSYSGFHSSMDPGILDAPFNHDGFSLDPIENESPPNMMGNAIFPPEPPPRFQIQHPGASNSGDNNINPNDVPQWVQNLRTGSYNAMGMPHPTQLLRPQQPVRVQLAPQGPMVTSPRPLLNNPRPLTNGYMNSNHLNHQSKEHHEKIGIPRHSSLASPDSEIKVSPGKKLIDQVNAQITNASPLLATTIYTLGFETQVKQPKSRDLLTQSSEIYPLIGGFGPFIIPSISIDEKGEKGEKGEKDEHNKREEKSSDTLHEKKN